MTTPYWQTIPFSPAPCLPCCSAPAPGCMCALLIGADLTTTPITPYASYADAVTGIADHTNNCIAYYEVAGVLGGLTASFDGTTLAVSGTDNSSPPVLGVSIWASMSMKAGSVLTIARTITAPAAIFDTTVTLYFCDGTQVDQNQIISPSPTGSQTLTAPADGEYYIVIGATAQLSGASHLIYAANVTCDMTYWVNPVIALWDDSGTTRKLWACPKMLLPPLTESTGTWYASCADANTVLTDPLQVSNCVGYWNPIAAEVTSIIATDGGASLSFSTDASGAGFNGDTHAWGSVNAAAGATLSMAWTSAVNGRMYIYDDTGALIQTIGPSVGSPLVSSPLPYTGRYTLYCEAYNGIFDPPVAATTVTITSSGAMTVNQIQARWDGGLTCPNTLDCGDACP